MFKMNRPMRARWQSEEIDRRLAVAVLCRRLEELAMAPFVRRSECCLLKPLAVGTGAGFGAFPDKTGYEAFVNSIHVDDFLDDCWQSSGGVGGLLEQSVLYALAIARRLEGESGPFRILLTLDPERPTSTVRFFQRRKGEIWGPTDLTNHDSEEFLLIDVEATCSTSM